MSLDLTIAIPTLNEQTNLPRCLASIGPSLARQIVVIDSGSTDRTVDIAREWGVTVLRFHWDGRFPKKRNWFLRHHSPATEWVLFLDADEFLTEAFRREITSALPGSSHSGYRLRYFIHFLGKRLRGGYPLEKVALIRVGSGEYEAIEEDHWSHLDMEVHEHPILRGSIGQLWAHIDHQDFRGMNHYLAKHNEYSSWEAARFLSMMRDPSARNRWTWKQRIKYTFVPTPLIAFVYFFGSYFLMGGWRDGSVGLSFAITKSAYFVQIACKIRELQPAAPHL